MSDYILLPFVWDQVGPLAEVNVGFDGVSIYCSAGAINVKINGIDFGLNVDEYLDEGFLGRTFEVEGTGTWRGYLKGAK